MKSQKYIAFGWRLLMVLSTCGAVPAWSQGGGGGGGNGPGATSTAVIYSGVTIKEYAFIDGLHAIRISDASSPDVMHGCNPTTFSGMLYLDPNLSADDADVMLMLAYLTKSEVELIVDDSSPIVCNQSAEVINPSSTHYPDADNHPGAGVKLYGFSISNY